MKKKHKRTHPLAPSTTLPAWGWGIRRVPQDSCGGVPGEEPAHANYMQEKNRQARGHTTTAPHDTYWKGAVPGGPPSGKAAGPTPTRIAPRVGGTAAGARGPPTTRGDHARPVVAMGLSPPWRKARCAGAPPTPACKNRRGTRGAGTGKCARGLGHPLLYKGRPASKEKNPSIDEAGHGGPAHRREMQDDVTANANGGPAHRHMQSNKRGGKNDAPDCSRAHHGRKQAARRSDKQAQHDTCRGPAHRHHGA